MTDWSVQSMADDPQVLAKRLAAFVQPIPAKVLSRRVGCDVRTAENMRRGHWPIARHWLGLLAAFGEDLTEAVFHPEKAKERLEREIHALERELEEKRRLANEVASDRVGRAAAADAHPGP
jgi:3'-phosphoadenosine 5'-phosphosulfate sulfotransferase (PAPS reductase)/FAD synthetase